MRKSGLSAGVSTALLLFLALEAHAEQLYFQHSFDPGKILNRNWLTVANWFTVDQNGNPVAPAGRIPNSADTALLHEPAELSNVASAQGLTVFQGGALIGVGDLSVENLNMQ